MSGKAGGAPRRMASLFSLSSFLENTRPLLFPNPNPSLRFSSPRPITFWRCVRANGERESSSPPPLTVEKRSLAVATGELFLGLASVLLRIRSSSVGGAVVVSEEKEEAGYSGSRGKVASVIEESVIWEQISDGLVAERERKKVTSPGFSFSAAGLLFPYHLGVARLLLENGYIKAVLRNVLNEFLPEDVHIRSNGRVRVAITQLSWRPKGLLVDQFDSKEDLINAVITSSFIPGYLAPRPATLYRNRLCIDGGLTSFMPPTSALKTVRVCAFPTKRMGLRDIGISPDCNPENRASTRQLFNWALEPAEDNILDRLYELGYLDAKVWAEQNPVDSIVMEESSPK
ncbi:uncharacterized protein LOC110101545 isoform X2 [Dendrobium catenatum]|uniref:uncharacterized protein LOC110101545 isoform X2 n=1 Tax=Dendrobium catenatum TaxID=906689 RepID=UPI0009F53B88|nr:uncharacterized protein LOC110101545 isoform X2 [Dendrobium catenatum]